MAFDLRPTLSDVLFDNGISLTLATIYSKLRLAFCFGYFGKTLHTILAESQRFKARTATKISFGIFWLSTPISAALDDRSLGPHGRLFGELVCPARRYFGHEVDYPARRSQYGNDHIVCDRLKADQGAYHSLVVPPVEREGERVF